MSEATKTPEELAAEAEAKKKADEEEAAKKAADKKKKLFDAEQTAFINDLYAKAFAEGAAKVEERLKAVQAEEKKEREALAAKLAELQKPKEEKKPETNPEIEAFKAQLAEVQGVLTGIKTERDELKQRVLSAEDERRKSRKKDEFLNAMKEANVSFFDPLEAYSLAEQAGYEWDKDTEKPLILNKETKRPKLNENGEPMSVLDFVKDFADKKKYLVKAPTQDGGTGGGEERRIEKKKETEFPDFAKMSDAEFAAYQQKILNGKG